MNAAAGKPDRVLLVIVSAIALLVVVALAVVSTRGGPPVLDESTPQGVVQRYSTAVIEGDTATASTYLTSAASSLCRSTRESGPLPSRVVLISTTERGTTALVRVSIVSSGSDGPFGPSEYETQDRFSLVTINGKWLVDQAPYPLLFCVGSSVKQ
ncbi:hypothetical protein BMF89_00325 [Arthrobacter sp. SRS-W-1-2016]|uniref:hypothetical protein n=1 Tax=Arthrobacter sp. SRS-W-1-2016 TaxID=1930254 RepID=UPI0009914562|nr:hypothetical protein [Arthrobacter sp. SRS-W-1-2016]OOP65243.1 hypothetical protein BMF89_00325 [Arthrobacter sp. SRS-W-1-2016]